MPDGARSRVCIVLVAWAVGVARAQVFSFDSMPFPPSYTMSTHYIFYVEASEGSEKPYAEFRQLGARATQPGQATKLDSYQSVQVALLPYDLFWNLVDEERFCSNADDVTAMIADKPSQFLLAKKGGSLVQTVNSEGSSSSRQVVRLPLNKTGTYILAYSNCGIFTNATVSGSFAVKNPFGYLPANEYTTMQFYGWLTVFYIGVNIVWLATLVRYFKNLFYVQSTLGYITFLALLEALATWVQYKDWNNTGVRRDPLVLATLLCSTLKHVVSWRLMLMAALGSGMTFQEMETSTAVKFFLVSVCLMLQQCIWKMVLCFRYSYALSAGFLVANALPGILVYAVLFAWSFSALSGILRHLEQMQQIEAKAVFRKARTILVVALLLCTAVSVVQLLDCAYTTLFSWRFQWLPTDGLPGLLFLFILLAMLCVWAPTQESWKFSYMPAGGLDAGEQVGADSDGDGDRAQTEDRAKFIEPMPRARQADKALRKAAVVAPEAIGVPAEQEAEECEGAVLL